MADIVRQIEHGPMPSAHKASSQLRPFNIVCIFVMSFASIAMGYSASIIATTLAQPTFFEYFGLLTRANGTQLIAAMNGIFQAGAFFGALCISLVADRLGRKMAITIPAVLVVISGACLAGSVNIGMFIAFRFFNGMGSFWLLGSVPVWMTEIVPPKHRGLLVDVHSAALLFGYSVASWTGFGFSHLSNNGAWRGPLALQCLPALIVLSAMPWLPESPRYLIQKGKHQQARTVLARLHAAEEAAFEFAQIETQVQIDSTLPNTWASLVTKKSYRKRALYAVGLACGIQFTGVLVVNNYSSIIYTGLGFTTEKVLIYQAGFNTLAFGCGVIAMFVIDLFPRQILTGVGTILVTSCLVVEAAIVANFKVGPAQNNPALEAGVAMTYCYIAFAELLLDGTQYVYYAELFPTHLRSKGMTIGMGSIALMNVMWLQVAPTAFKEISWKFYLCFIIPAYIFAVICIMFYPNTKGLALEEIAALFGDETAEVSELTRADDLTAVNEKSAGVMHVNDASRDSE